MVNMVNKRYPTSTEELSMSIKKPEEPLLKAKEMTRKIT